MGGKDILYILMRRFHSFFSLFSARMAFSASASLLSLLSAAGGGGVGGVGAPHAGGRKLTKRFAESESDAVWFWYVRYEGCVSSLTIGSVRSSGGGRMFAVSGENGQQIRDGVGWVRAIKMEMRLRM